MSKEITLTYTKPTQQGYYWYSRCYYNKGYTPISTFGVIYIDLIDKLYSNISNHFLVAVFQFTGEIVRLHTLTGMFSKNPISIPKNIF